tara:strand:+ start:1824 stop:2516 length:693 start_codon:yes stop_codon:yes gene_type:complete
MKLFLLGKFQKIKFLIEYLVSKNFSEPLFIKKYIKEGSVIVDIGSNVGSFIDSINRFDNNYFFHSIEPNLELIKYQKKKYRKLKRINFYNLAISNKGGESPFYIRTPSSHSSLKEEHIDSEFNNEVSIKKVKTLALDTFVKSENITKIDLLKIDTEGSEIDILESSKNLIKSGLIKYIKIEATSSAINSIFEFAKKTDLKVIGVNNIFHFENTFNFFDLYLENTNIKHNE